MAADDSDRGTPQAPLKLVRSSKVDMSPEAVDARIRRFCRLMELSLSLKRAKRLGPVEQKAGQPETRQSEPGNPEPSES